MAKRRRQRRGGRVTPKGTRPLGSGRGSLRVVPDDPGASEELDLMGEMRARLAMGDPLDFLAEVSGVLTVVDPRSVSPMERASGKEVKTSALSLMDSFADDDRLETTAMLAAIAQLGFNDGLRRRAASAVARRRQPLPEWLERLGESVAYRAVEMVHVLGDGDDVMIGVRMPTGDELTVVLYVDHNMGTVAKDGFVVPGPIGQVVGLMKSHPEAPDDTELKELDLADARARAEEALSNGAMLWSQPKSDSWPQSRPLVEWAVRLLPEGGSGYRRQDWSEADRAELTKDFFASPFAEAVRGGSYRDLFEPLLWFGCDNPPGDPLRWSPVAVEVLLADWVPRRIIAGVGFLSKMPDLLRAFIQYAHDRRGVPSKLTAETLTAVDEWEPHFQRLIRADRPQRPGSKPFDDEPFFDDPWDEPLEPLDVNEIVLDSLREAVGGAEALESLDARPLPDEDFDWEGVADDIREAVAEVLRLCDRYADDVLDVEFRTALRRLLARAARGDPKVFRRRARADTAASALCWAIGKANDLFSPYGRGLLIKDMAAYFGLKGSTASQRANTLINAAGARPDYESYSSPYAFSYYYSSDLPLGAPDLLVSTRRRRILELRDRYSQTEG